MKKTAIKYLTDYLVKILNDNFDELNSINSNVDNNLVKDLKKDETLIQWVLFEVINSSKFKDIIIIDTHSDDKSYTTILKIGNKYIKGSQDLTNYLNFYQKPFKFEFVKPVKKKITVIEYVPISKKVKL